MILEMTASGAKLWQFGYDDYVEKMLVKYVDYVHQGIVPWDNFVMTFDKKNGGLDVGEIDFIIEHRILV